MHIIAIAIYQEKMRHFMSFDSMHMAIAIVEGKNTLASGCKYIFCSCDSNDVACKEMVGVQKVEIELVNC